MFLVFCDVAFHQLVVGYYLDRQQNDSTWSFEALGRIRAAVDKHGDGPRTKWKFLGKDVCVAAWKKKLHALGCLTNNSANSFGWKNSVIIIFWVFIFDSIQSLRALGYPCGLHSASSQGFGGTIRFDSLIILPDFYPAL